MAWTELTRRQHARVGDKYASDLTDAEWALIEPLMPPRKTTGRPRTTRLRDVFDAILYVATSGCQWRMLPNDFPPVSTVRGYFYMWRNDGLLDEINRRMVEAARLAEGRKAQPTAGIIDRRASWRQCSSPLASARKPRKVAGLEGMTQASGSRVASAIS